MKARLLTAAALVLVLSTGVVEAGFADISFNDQAFDLWVGFGLGKDEEAQFTLGGRYLDNGDEDTSLPSVLLAFASKPAANDAIDFSLGAQVMLGESHDQDVQGIAIGGLGTWQPEGWKGVFVGGRLFYTPSVFCFGNTDGAFEWSVQGGYAFNPKMRIFVEYGDFEADIENAGSVKVDDGAKIGFGARF